VQPTDAATIMIGTLLLLAGQASPTSFLPSVLRARSRMSCYA
jgi:hypothetical protein